MKSAGRAIAAAALAGLIGAVWVALFYAWHPAIVVEFINTAPISDHDRDLICHGNAERILKLR